MRKHVGAGILIALGTAVAGIAPATGQGSVAVRFGLLYQTHSASTFDPIYPEAAKKSGLAVQIIPFQRYSDVQITLATGRIDAGAFGYANIPIMAEQNIHNVQIIAGQSVGAQGVTLRERQARQQAVPRHRLPGSERAAGTVNHLIEQEVRRAFEDRVSAGDRPPGPAEALTPKADRLRSP
ncbi:MAG TPA: hypothetical protein VJT32_16215 [bacterium]|nr:hypothetical protein [bacterium]